jgi:putative spermidine/putrescine transport system permease protein
VDGADADLERASGSPTARRLWRKRSSVEAQEKLGFTSSLAAWFGYGFLILPSLVVVPMSFGDRDVISFPPENWSFFLYEKFFTDSAWIGSTYQSFFVGICTTFLALCLGVPAAYGLVRGRFPGRTVLTVAFVSPMVIPLIVIALALYLYFSILQIQGSTLALVLGHTTIAVPFVVITAMSGLRNIDPTLERATMIMGAGRIYILYHVTLPLLRPSIVGGGLFAFIISFDEVVISWFISSAETMTLPVKMYSSLRWEISPVLAAVSALLTGLSVIVCLIAAYFQKPE